MFVQLDNGTPFPPDPDLYYEPSAFDWLSVLFGYSVLPLAVLALKIWMVVECLRKDPDRYLWIWIIIFVPFGSAIYFFLRWLPNNQIRAPQSLRKWTRGREIVRLQMEAKQIGNPHQHIRLGDALREIGQFADAGDAYAQAIEKEPENLQALWGSALVDIHFKDYDSALVSLKQLLDIDLHYKFGDVSLAYGKTLLKLDKTDAAITHFEPHVRRWPQPEALYTLACLHSDAGNEEEARKHLLEMMLGINSSPRATARKYGIWKSKGRRLLRRLSPRG